MSYMGKGGYWDVGKKLCVYHLSRRARQAKICLMSKDDHTQPPAWRGARPHASATVPPDFEQVSSLGPVMRVTEHKGIRLPSFGPPPVNLMGRYHDGLAYRASGQEVHTLPWPERSGLTSHIT